MRRSQTAATLAGKIIGTPQYMAPEQIDHPSEVDHRADIYALGVVFYQMLTGELPGKDLQAPSRKVSIDVRLDEMVLRALEEKPERRYQTALEFRTLLDGLPPATPPPVPKRGMIRRWRWVFLVMIPLGTLLGFVAAGALTYVMPKKYEAEAIVEVIPANGSAITPAFLGNQCQAIKSSAALTAVSQELELPNKWMTDGETAVGILKAIISTQNIRGTDLIAIKVRHTNPEDAVGITYAVILNYQRSFVGKVIVHDTPQPPRMPVTPNVTLNLVIGSAGGLLLSPLMALVLIMLLHAVFPETKSINSPPQASQQASVMKTRVEAFAEVGNAMETISETGFVPLRDKAVRWIIHLVWAASTSGLVALAVMFVAEILTKDRGNLNRSLMTWEDVYGPVITVILGCGLLAIPIKAFRFASARVWIGAVFATAGITAITYVLAAPVEDPAFHADNFIVMVAICAFGASLGGFAAVFGKERFSAPNKPSVFWPIKAGWIAAVIVVTGVLWFFLRDGGKSYPGSSSNSAFAAVMLRAYDWNDLAASGQAGGGVLVTVDGQTCLKIENPNDSALSTRLLTIVTPPLKARRYAVMGEVRYENIQGMAYLEMWNEFPQGRFFSRTMDKPGSGAMGQLTGTSDWRPFILPFDQQKIANPPNRIEVNLHLPGHGVVIIGPLRLCELGTEEVAEDQLKFRSEERNEEPKSQADEVAKGWLTKIDTGDYKQSWKDAAEFFQKAITEAGWSEAMTKFRKPLGAVKSRKLLDAKSAKSLPGAPDGEYVVMQFETSFAAKQKGLETVTFMKQEDGSWKAAGYFIR
jgi:capsular polysaccharide biosynthesis protein